VVTHGSFLLGCDYWVWVQGIRDSSRKGDFITGGNLNGQIHIFIRSKNRVKNNFFVFFLDAGVLGTHKRSYAKLYPFPPLLSDTKNKVTPNLTGLAYRNPLCSEASVPLFADLSVWVGGMERYHYLRQRSVVGPIKQPFFPLLHVPPLLCCTVATF
jgi:hypothetical protein